MGMALGSREAIERLVVDKALHRFGLTEWTEWGEPDYETDVDALGDPVDLDPDWSDDEFAGFEEENQREALALRYLTAYTGDKQPEPPAALVAMRKRAQRAPGALSNLKPVSAFKGMIGIRASPQMPDELIAAGYRIRCNDEGYYWFNVRRKESMSGTVETAEEAVQNAGEDHGGRERQYTHMLPDDLAAAELTVTERAELGRFEAVIGRGLETFLDVGRALIAIREGRLYRATHATFEDYCRGRWEIGKSRMYQLIDAAQVVENLEKSTIVELPANEAQVRPLASLEPDQQVAAWKQATEVAGGRPTAAQVQKAADAIRPQYAPVWELERKVSEWLSEQERDGGDPNLLLDTLKYSDGHPSISKSGKLLFEWLGSFGLSYKENSLIQAISNVREQRRQAKLQASAKVVYVEPEPPQPMDDGEITELSIPSPFIYNPIRIAGFVIERKAIGIHPVFRWAWPQRGNAYHGEWLGYVMAAADQALRWYEAHLPPEPVAEEATDPSGEELEAMAEVAEEREEEERERLGMTTRDEPRVTRRSLAEIPPDLKRYGYDIHQLLRDGEEDGHWWYDHKAGGAGAWGSAEVAIERARDDLQRRKSHVASYITGYLVRDSSANEFDMALEQARIDHLQESLASTQLSKTRRGKIEARIRRLTREQPTVVEPDVEDLEQEADDGSATLTTSLQVMTPTAFLTRVEYGPEGEAPTACPEPSTRGDRSERVILTLDRAIAERLYLAVRNDALERFMGEAEIKAVRNELKKVCSP